jgi:hypothetical protein
MTGADVREASFAAHRQRPSPTEVVQKLADAGAWTVVLDRFGRPGPALFFAVATQFPAQANMVYSPDLASAISIAAPIRSRAQVVFFRIDGVVQMNFKANLVALGAIASALAMTTSAHAALTLTAAGVTDGFSLSNFYSDPSTYYGALSATTMANGKVIVAGYGHGQIMTFNNADGQTYASALQKVAAPGTPYAVATVGGKTYYTDTTGGYYKVDPTTLALTQLTLDNPAVRSSLGLWANQVSGNLISDSNIGMVEINPTNGHVRYIAPGQDGVSVSPDGLIAYTASPGAINGYNIASGANVFSIGDIHGADGTGVISGSAFNGFIVVNNNDGTVGLIDPTTSIQTIIADGGTRGDFVGPDLTNGTLFLSEADNMFRLGIKGGGIGGPPPTPGVPEPATWAFLVLGFGSLGAMLRRRRVQVTHAA